ncbi:hypothetical protein CRI94_08910 [Longibacter salinarum]|uniref:Alpha-glucosidase n=1 Tax=Longibacter salinarum TaxID=1850348 RepID=A0A2A8CXT8_9BACT|nr:glycoside hydrolase family 31 protein [Longibacter salinarum]PEN13431.1 hypothetical protein CRI94_08910 [Longibacter salinarum]
MSESFYRFLGMLGVLVLLTFRPVHAQPAEIAPGDYTGHRLDDAVLVVEGENATARISFYRPEMLRVEWLPADVASADTSFAVIRTPDYTPTIRDTDEALYLRTAELTATVHKSPLRVTIADDRGRSLLSEMERPLLVTDSTRTVQFAADSTMAVYGTGERGGSFNLQGRAFDVYNTQHYGYSEAPATMKINVPLAVTTGGFALFMDEVDRGRFDIGASTSGRFAYTSEYGAVSYVVIATDDIREQLRHYTWLTGRQPMPPKWALGYIQSKYGYRTEAQARGVVDTLREKGFPVDAVVLDLHWFEHMGDLDWNRDDWPTPFEMMDDLSDRGVQTVAITETYISGPSDLFQPAIDDGHVGTHPDGSAYRLPDWWSCPDGCPALLADMTRPETRDWWWEKHPPFMGDSVAVGDSTKGAMAGLWTDLGEPEKHPDDMEHHLGPAPVIHNAYDLLWAETLYRGLRETRPNQRVFNLTRSGSAGIQRYGTVHWSGDVARSFTGLAQQPSLMLQAGLSGLPLYGSDIGGYLGDAKSPELMVRWMQHGALSPTMRPHGVDNLPTEPWHFGAQAESIMRDYVRLRYRLMPYLYTLAYEAHASGLPLARPLFFADPEDPALQEASEAYLMGDALLVAPVMKEGARSVDIPLPEGEWMDWWTGEVTSGGRMITADAPLDRMPMYQKAGTIVPMRPVRSHTAAQPADTLDLRVVPEVGRTAADASFRLYEDDGSTMNYTRGDYALTNITQTFRADGDTGVLRLTMSPAAGSYDGFPDERTVRASLHRVASVPSEVSVGNRTLTERASTSDVLARGGFHYDGDTGVLTVQVRLSTTTAHAIVARGVSLR